MSFQEFKEELPVNRPITNKKSIDINGDHQNRLAEKDLDNKIRLRPQLLWLLFGLVFIQNVAVFTIWIYLATQNKLKDLELLMQTLATATLGESYFLIKFSVEFIFSSNNSIPKKLEK